MSEEIQEGLIATVYALIVLAMAYGMFGGFK